MQEKLLLEYEKLSEGNDMKLKHKILLLSVTPVILLGAVLYLIASSHIKNGIYQQAYSGMHATALAIRDVFEVNNSGEYYLDENNELWKGDTLNISKATGIVDQIKANTELEVTVFYQDTRFLTTITNEDGERQINTQSLPIVAETVLEKGKDYYKDHVDILGTKYVVYYIPLYQENTTSPVGMIFIGTKQAAVDKVINDMQHKFNLYSLIIIAIIAAVISFLSQRIMKPLTASVAAINKISGGTLHISINDKYKSRKDEIGDICRSVENLDNKLIRIIGAIKKNSESLITSSQELDTTAREASSSIGQVDFVVQEIASSSSQQAVSTEEAAHDVSSMGDMVQDTMNTIKDLNNTTSTMKQASDASKDTLVNLNHSMGSVMEVIESISEQTNRTNDSVLKINEAAILIKAIANQTNLLALNASIEAARAGEQGKGFAVVASEIKHLSSQSNTSAAEIQEILEQLTSNSGQAVVLMQEVKESITKQKDNIHKTVEVFKTVESGISESVGGIQIISEKTETMNLARTKTVRVVDSLTAIAEENAASTEEAAASVEEVRKLVQDVAAHANGLNTIAEELKISIDVFKL